MNDLEIEQVIFASDDARQLIQELDQELSEIYSPKQRHGLPLDSIFQPHLRFFIARITGVAVGCGGVAFFSGFAEVKRMYVRRPWRGCAVADAIMARLLSEASHAGFKLVRLEAGMYSTAAIRFYRRCGFNDCAAFGTYSSMPASAIISSVFMQKQLA